MRRHASIWAVLATALLACGGSDTTAQSPRPQPPQQPRRVAAEAGDLRVMFAEITATRACEQFRNMFRAIGGEGDSPVTGSLWIQECEAFADETAVTLQLAGRGWRYISRTSETVGAEFEVATYVPFTFSVEVRGKIDVAYATEPHVLTLWFTPSGPPEATFEPIGEVEVETEGLWSSVVGALASAFASSPEERAADKVSTKGQQQIEDQFAQGIAATVDLCTGHVRTGFGHPKAGEMLGPPAKITENTAVLHPGGVLLHGPVLVPEDGIEIEVPGGAVTSSLVCTEEATKLAAALLEGRPIPSVPTVASVKVRDRAVLDVPKKGTSCRLIHVLRPLAGAKGGVKVTYEVNELTADLPKLGTCKKAEATKQAEAKPASDAKEKAAKKANAGDEGTKDARR